MRSKPRLRGHLTGLTHVEVRPVAHSTWVLVQSLGLCALDAGPVLGWVRILQVGPVAEVGQGRTDLGPSLGLDQLLHVIGHAAFVLGLGELRGQQDGLLRGVLETVEGIFDGLGGHGIALGITTALGFDLQLSQLGHFGLQFGVERGVIHHTVLATGLRSHGQLSQWAVHLAVDVPSLLFTGWAKLVAMDGVAKEVVNGAELLVLVQAGVLVNVVQEVVLVAALEDVQVAVAQHVTGHLFRTVVVALTVAVKRHAHGHLVELVSGLFSQLAVRLLQQVVVALGPHGADHLGHLLGIGVKDGLLVLRRSIHRSHVGGGDG